MTAKDARDVVGVSVTRLRRVCRQLADLQEDWQLLDAGEVRAVVDLVQHELAEVLCVLVNRAIYGEDQAGQVVSYSDRVKQRKDSPLKERKFLRVG